MKYLLMFLQHMKFTLGRECGLSIADKSADSFCVCGSEMSLPNVIRAESGSFPRHSTRAAKNEWRSKQSFSNW